MSKQLTFSAVLSVMAMAVLAFSTGFGATEAGETRTAYAPSMVTQANN